jgi:hypothetical protein
MRCIEDSERSTAWTKVVDRVMLSFLALAAACVRLISLFSRYLVEFTHVDDDAY